MESYEDLDPHTENSGSDQEYFPGKDQSGTDYAENNFEDSESPNLCGYEQGYVPEGDHGNPDYSESDAGYGEDPFTVAIDYDAAYHLGGAEMLHPSQRPISQCEYWHEHPPEKPDPVTAHRQKNDEARNGAAWGGAIQ